MAIENINLNFKTLEEKQQWQQRFQKLPGVTPTSSFLFNVELGGATTSKAHALQALLDEWKMTSQQVMAFGDSENDLGMIQLAGIGVAMANGMEEVRQAADILAESNEEDGVAKIIEQLIGDI